MDINFEQGNANHPKGHAILYFRSPTDLLASYIVILPLLVDFSKYIPPFMATQVKDAGLEQFSSFAMPPLPEKVKSYEAIETLARVRGDDLIFGGSISSEDFVDTAERVNDAVQSYTNLYKGQTEIEIIEERNTGESSTKKTPELTVGEVVYSLMSERDKLRELTKLIGKLRFTMEGKDKRQMAEAKLELEALGKYLSDRFNISRLIEVTESSMEQGHRLVELYLERCYKLCDEDYLELQKRAKL